MRATAAGCNAIVTHRPRLGQHAAEMSVEVAP
jgi:hypothetical protein